MLDRLVAQMILAAFLVLPALSPAAEVDRYDSTGLWITSLGLMKLNQEGENVSGSYTTDNGEILGTLRGTVLEGHWIEDDSAERCAEPKNGRHHWGRIELRFEGDRFTGRWGYCDGPFQGEVTGKRK
jgi:hypothetical protein